jgi:cell division transport system ATP-binding protein
MGDEMTARDGPMVEFEHVSMVYPEGTEALEDVTVAIDEGEFVFIVGPTGEGKSTLIKLIYRELLPTMGRVLVAGGDVAALPLRKVPHLRRRIGVVFQDFRLLPHQTVFENVAFALRVVGEGGRNIRRRVPELLAQVGLADRPNALPSQLSGGEQQRVSIARALAHEPPIFLADEPTGNLDPDTSWEIMQLIARVIAERGTTVIVATHDKLMVDAMHKRVIELSNGRVVRDAPEAGY